MSSRVNVDTIGVEVRGRSLEVSFLRRPGPEGTLLFLHGFGSSKHDFVPALHAHGLRDLDIVALDFPGCGSSPCPAWGLDVEDLVDVVGTVAAKLDLEAVTLVGHSLGGAVGLLLAERFPDLVKRFVDLEGNLAPEDCFLSRELAALEPESYRTGAHIDAVRRTLKGDSTTGARLFAGRFHREVDPRAARDYLVSLVRLSDEGGLLERLIRLSCELAFVYGERNRHLSYLPVLEKRGILLVEIPGGGHWAYADAPVFFYRWLAGWLSPKQAALHDVHQIAADATGNWYNVPVCEVNEHVVRLSVMRRDFHWHRHPDTDELFYVVDGRLHVDLEGASLTLRPGQMTVVPRGTLHRTRPQGRSVNLTFEAVGTDPRGDRALIQSGPGQATPGGHRSPSPPARGPRS